MKLGLREANQRFAHAIRAVRSGREVILTDRGKPLAVIRRVDATDADAQLASMAADGLVTLARRTGSMPAPRWRPEALTGASIAQAVARDRDESA